MLQPPARTARRDRARISRSARRHGFASARRRFDNAHAAPLLERARRELNDPQREATLLAAGTTTERLPIEIEQLLAITRENVGRDIRALLRPAMEAVLQAIAAALQERAHQAATGLRSFNASNYEGLSMAIRSRLDEIQAQENLVLGSFVQRTRPR